MEIQRRVLLGVTGGIAAYKSADLVRRLKRAGFEVRVVMTRGAEEFLRPLTFQALSGYPVHRELFDEEAEAAMGHIELARWADLVLVAPATADFLARLRYGLGNDLLTTLCLATLAPTAVAPAMNQQMWAAGATQENIAVLRQRGVMQLGPAEGEQACGETGAGRMLEPEQLSAWVQDYFLPGALTDLKVLVTAGPTREPIDPVRYISNHSSGKMGYAVAAAAFEAGAEVTLVTGPTDLAIPSGVNSVDVVSAAEMHQGVMSRVAYHHIFIGAAAVADYRPETVNDQKIKKNSVQMHVDLEKTDDILADVAALPARPFTVGFAAETEKLEEHARDKLVRKSVDLIAANRVGVERTGFGGDMNELEVFWSGGHRQLELAPKHEVARALIALVADRYHAQHSA
ncbi:MAG: bifunctional phosphopantothenoylcysteine decarboxylase/phosphopantothenate--cysteine ligase CoaBC [Thiotrichales bacterium]|nr:bifunctional phosphopantothenoylcysteine decarboxylase/phosphopantothenate--cysteine ligase CoaBC [Thiotrichales bacterium]